jgi:4-deoxy-L-threo-5-hexosulose-uronate ketol-isomerase
VEVRYLPNDQSYQRLATEELRAAFVLESLLVEGELRSAYCETDRAIVGGAVPVEGPLELLASRKEMAASYFLERREAGIVNLGGEGVVRADGVEHVLRYRDMLYVGRGTRTVEFRSSVSGQPAVFYFVSYPAHATHPAALARYGETDRSALGSPEGANVRTINRYIHTGGVKSCQLVMGLTELSPGSVWNTMPPHTHQRRTEIYLYCGLGPGEVVIHLMGKPRETRSLILRDREAVISPSWSIHCAAGTGRYTFVWAMGGENQEFSDMDAVPMTELR